MFAKSPGRGQGNLQGDREMISSLELNKKYALEAVLEGI